MSNSWANWERLSNRQLKPNTNFNPMIELGSIRFDTTLISFCDVWRLEHTTSPNREISFQRSSIQKQWGLSVTEDAIVRLTGMTGCQHNFGNMAELSLHIRHPCDSGASTNIAGVWQRRPLRTMVQSHVTTAQTRQLLAGLMDFGSTRCCFKRFVVVTDVTICQKCASS